MNIVVTWKEKGLFNKNKGEVRKGTLINITDGEYPTTVWVLWNNQIVGIPIQYVIKVEAENE